MSERAPQTVGDYTLVRPLGEGGMGSVFLARKKGEERDVALKLLHSDLARHERFVKRFHREAKLASSFDHPNLVAVLDTGTDTKSLDHYIVYEYIGGGDLTDLVAMQVMDEKRALELTRALADALRYANSESIVHRDVKPDNILMTEGGVPKLADLGLAKVLDPDVTQLTRAGTVLGTPYYMSPEQARGSEELDGRSDQYALGLCLWNMLTGAQPFDPDGEATKLQVIRRRLVDDLPDVRDSRPDVSEATSQLIRYMTKGQREDRYPNADAVQEDIKRILAGESITGPGAATSELDAATVRQAAATRDPNKASTEFGVDDRASQALTAAMPPLAQPKPPKASTQGKGETAAKAATLVPGLPEFVRADRRTLAILAGLILLPVVLCISLAGLFGEDPPDGVGATDGTIDGATDGTTDGPLDGATDGTTDGTADGSTPIGSTDGATDGSRPTDTTDPWQPLPDAPETEELPPLPPGSRGKLGIARVRELSLAMFTNVERGRALLNTWLDEEEWQRLEQTRRFLTWMKSLAFALGHSNWVQRAAALRALDRELTRYEDLPPLRGNLGKVVDQELGYWSAFIRGVLEVHRSVAEPRIRDAGLTAFNSIPLSHQARRHVRFFLGLLDRLDHHHRWVRVDRRRQELRDALSRAVPKRLGAAGFVLQEELAALRAVLTLLVEDDEGCLIAALTDASLVDLRSSELLRSRVLEVPNNASRRAMPGWGLLFDVEGPPQKAVIQIDVVTPEDTIPIRISKSRVKVGETVRPVSWSGNRIIVEARPQGVLVRFPGSSPSDFKLTHSPERSEYQARYSVRPGSARIVRTILARIPQREDPLFRTTPDEDGQ